MKTIIIILTATLVGVGFFSLEKSTATTQIKREALKVDVNGAIHCVDCSAGVYAVREYSKVRRCSFCDKPEPQK